MRGCGHNGTVRPLPGKPVSSSLLTGCWGPPSSFPAPPVGTGPLPVRHFRRARRGRKGLRLALFAPGRAGECRAGGRRPEVPSRIAKSTVWPTLPEKRPRLGSQRFSGQGWTAVPARCHFKSRLGCFLHTGSSRESGSWDSASSLQSDQWQFYSVGCQVGGPVDSGFLVPEPPPRGVESSRVSQDVAGACGGRLRGLVRGS